MEIKITILQNIVSFWLGRSSIGDSCKKKIDHSLKWSDRSKGLDTHA